MVARTMGADPIGGKPTGGKTIGSKPIGIYTVFFEKQGVFRRSNGKSPLECSLNRLYGRGNWSFYWILSNQRTKIL
jgi:hypothetical protein